MGNASQRKGRRGEIDLASILNANGYDCRPGAALNYGTEPDIVGLPGIHAEVKRVEALNVSKAMKQAVRDSEKFQDGAPVLFHRRNGEGWLVTMRLEDWLNIARNER